MRVVNTAGFPIRLTVNRLPLDLMADGKPVFVDDAYQASAQCIDLFQKGWLRLYTEPAPKAETLPIVPSDKSSLRKKRSRPSSL